MSRRIVIIGCGGFGREVFSLLHAQRSLGVDWLVEGFVDDSPSDENLKLVAGLGSRVLGPIAYLSELLDINAVIAVGAPQSRQLISDRLSTSPIGWPVLVHPDTTIGVNVTLDEGVVIAAGARLSTNISARRHVHIDQNATVGHDVVIGDFARLNPLACVSGHVSVGDRALVGANATVLAGVRIGSDATVGAAACVVRDVAERATVKGIPAR